MNRRRVDGAQIAKQAVDEVLAAYPDRDVVVHATGDTAGDWDADRLAQVLGNFLSNAVKYGALTTPITVQVRDDGDAVVFSVHNEGDAVPADLLPRLFLPLERGKSHSQGVGLGLFIVKHIVEAHGGSVDVRSLDAEGTRFTARVPRTG